MSTGMYSSSMFRNRRPSSHTSSDRRFQVLFVLYIIVALAILIRLFHLMVFQHGFYSALAAGSQGTHAKLVPDRGQIYMQDSRTHETYPLAINRDYFLVFADTRLITSDETAKQAAEVFAELFHYTDEKKEAVLQKLNKRTDPYEPIEQKVDEEIVQKLREANLPGIGYVRRSYRYYPEGPLGAHITGFVGKNDQEVDVGKYGIEGYWNTELSGKGGFVEGRRSAVGGWISSAARSFDPAVNGSDMHLTIDRTLQYVACEKLRTGAIEHNATSAALIIMDPKTGAIRAMCSWPEFDPNEYKKVEAVNVYNNHAIFTPYEPGSIFKPIVMASAINEGLVNPNTPFFDTGYKDGICQKSIQNAGNKSHGTQTMTGVLEYSINTGMVHVAELLGKPRLKKYLENFGFGVKEGIELDTENTGTIASLSENKKDFDCYTATASFGQGLTVTPLQMVTAFAAIANGGKIMKPYIVDEMHRADGVVVKTKPQELRTVLTPRVASLVSGMLVSVVDSQYGGRARVKGYHVAGKSGTAQISGVGGYSTDFNHSFVGFAPVEDPKYVMLVRYEKPDLLYAESTAAPVFGQMSKFLLEYYHVPPNRSDS